VVRLLLDAQAAVDAATADGWTALHMAAFMGHTAVVQLLLSAHAAVEARTETDGTALHFVAQLGNAAVVQLGQLWMLLEQEVRQPFILQHILATLQSCSCCWKLVQR
jgi:hypothetical protein